jgi:hypothetical protein
VEERGTNQPPPLFFNSLLRKLNVLIPTVGYARPFPHVISHVKLEGLGIRTR